MTLIVLSIAVVALIVTFATGISASVDHRHLAANDVVLRQVEQQAFYLVQQQSSPLYTSCASLAGGQYAVLANNATYNKLPSGYSVTMINPIQYWDPNAAGGPAFDSTCAPDSPQLISLTLSAPNGSSATTTFVVDDLGAGPLGPLGGVTVSPPSGIQGTSNLALTLSGTGFASNVVVSINTLTTGIKLNSYTFVTSSLIDLNVSIAATATAQADSITVTDPTAPVQTALGTFTVTALTPTGMHVSAMGSFPLFGIPFFDIWPIVGVTVEDGNNKPMKHVTVSGTWSPLPAGGLFTANSCETDQSGTCYVFYGFLNFSPTAGPVTYTITNLADPPTNVPTYTPGSNNPSYGNPPTITVIIP